MSKYSSLRKPLLAICATLFGAATALYSVLWMYDVRLRSRVELGFENEYSAAGHCELVTSIIGDSPAERAGLKQGDRIIAINGRAIQSTHSLGDVWARQRPGDSVELTIKRPHVSLPLVVKGTFRASRDTSNEGGVTQYVSAEIIGTFPVAFLVVGLAVLLLRLEDGNAWLLALMFGGYIAIPHPVNAFALFHPSLRLFALLYRALLNSFVTPLFYFFFAVFPTRSPMDRRFPRLKWIALVLAGCVNLPPWLSNTLLSGMYLGNLGEGFSRTLILSFNYGLIALGIVSLIWNAISAGTPEARRKIRVILWGTLVGVVPATLFLAATDLLGYHPPFWLGAAVTVVLWLFPLSFAYAVVKHRVLEIPVLLRRSARYLLVQRGFLFLHILVSLGAAVAFAWGLSRTQFMTPVGLTGGVVFGSVLAFGGIRIHKATSQRVDRAFFRSAYDARTILEDLVEKTRTATDRNELAALLEHHLRQALQPVSFAVYLERSDGQLHAASKGVPPELETLSTSQPMLTELARHGRPWDVSGSNDSPHPFSLEPLQPECLVPILGRDGRLVGLVILGQRLSEEPYSREDKQLLAAAASQAGVALESMRLGEKIAERLEAERRVAQELEFAREVQARLFPQKLPRLDTLEYAGDCLPARQVGGDYYDFLELSPGRVALVLADIAGKGISGALLMANLQANLRSQYAMALDDLPRLLKSVNQLFYQNTSESSYATLFFADYDDASRRLRYANCGHLPPLLLRACEASPDGRKMPPAIERLEPTCTVLGLFEPWVCKVAEVQLAPGDMLVLYTDGVTEAENSSGEEYGEDRLIETVRCRRHLPANTLLETVLGSVQEFSNGKQNDDITLIVARCRS